MRSHRSARPFTVPMTGSPSRMAAQCFTGQPYGSYSLDYKKGCIDSPEDVSANARHQTDARQSKAQETTSLATVLPTW